MKTICLLDIDGCCLDSMHRVPLLLDGKYKEYAELWWKDAPIPQGVMIYSALLQNPELQCVFVTSRQESARATTLVQLENLFGDKSFLLLMRPEGNSDEDTVVKRALVEKEGIAWSDVFIEFDDRPSIVEMYRSLGCVAYQTDTGY